MDWFKKISYYYENGYWDIERVGFSVGKVITPEQYKTITGKVYANNSSPSVLDALNDKINDAELSINLMGAAIVDRIEDGESAIESIKGGV